MKLSTLLNTTDYVYVKGTLDKDIENLVYHSDKVTENSVFFAASGNITDGKNYIYEAAERGACCIVFSGESIDVKKKDVTLIKVRDVRQAMANMAAVFFDNPSEKLLVIGITGTKGKTTTAFMIRDILENAGIKTGLIGTIFNGYEDRLETSQGTTPEAIDLQRMLLKMVEGGCKAVVIEVSSQGLKHRRVENIDFDIGVFTNISPDHIGEGEHKTYEEYRDCKRKLFAMSKRAVINIDQREWPQIIAGSQHEKTIFYGKHEEADFRIGKRKKQYDVDCLGAEYILYSAKPCGDGSKKKIFVNMPGEFNIYNASAAIAVTKSLGIPWSIIEDSLRKIKVPGRTEIVPFNNTFTVMIDYAHNGVALKNLLESLLEYNPARIILVFGCGGNRDKHRRSEMAEIASKYADLIIITSDNPRLESQKKIAEDIKSHIPVNVRTLIINERRDAIERALQEGRNRDIIIVTGKGHENYQIIGNNIYHFDDKEEILKVKERNVL